MAVPPLSLLDISRSFKIGDQAEQRYAQQAAANLAAQGDLQGAAALAMKGGAPEGMSLLSLDAQNKARAQAQANADRSYELEKASAGRAAANVGMTPDINEYQFAKKQGFTGSFADWQTKKATGAGGGQYGLNVLYGEDADGNIVAMQPSKAGGVRTIEAPNGVSMMGPDDRAFAAKAGAARGTAAVDIPRVENNARTLTEGIDALAGDQSLGSITGPLDSWLPAWASWDSAGAQRAQSRMNLVQGKTFLQAYNDLRGAGAISEKEGDAAAKAYSRLSSTGQSDSDYQDALQDFRREVVKLADVARAKGSVRPRATVPSGASAPGAVQPPAASASPERKTGIDRRTGQTVTLENRGGQWVPVQ